MPASAWERGTSPAAPGSSPPRNGRNEPAAWRSSPARPSAPASSRRRAATSPARPRTAPPGWTTTTWSPTAYRPQAPRPVPTTLVAWPSSRSPTLTARSPRQETAGGSYSVIMCPSSAAPPGTWPPAAPGAASGRCRCGRRRRTTAPPPAARPGRPPPAGRRRCPARPGGRRPRRRPAARGARRRPPRAPAPAPRRWSAGRSRRAGRRPGRRRRAPAPRRRRPSAPWGRARRPGRRRSWPGPGRPGRRRWRGPGCPARPPAGPRPAGRPGAPSPARPAAGPRSPPCWSPCWSAAAPLCSPCLPAVRAPNLALAAAQHVRQVEGGGPLQLLVAAGARVAVGPPAAELGGVPEAAALHVVVGDLHHQLGAKRLPGQVLLGVPAGDRARDPRGRDRAEPRVLLAGLRPVGGQLVQQLPPPCHREGGGHADVLQPVLLVVEAEQQRADHRAALVPAEAGHHAVGGPLVLDLEHHPLVGQVGQVTGLGHHPVKAGALEQPEPALRQPERIGDGGQVDRVARAR